MAQADDHVEVSVSFDAHDVNAEVRRSQMMPGGCTHLGGECGCSSPLELSLNDYQFGAGMTDPGHSLEYYALGLGEAGEIQNKVKKIERDHDKVLTPEMREALLDEAGDLLWYVARFVAKLDSTLEEVASNNLIKLDDRKKRGVLKGSGDNR